MGFKDYSLVPAEVELVGDTTYVGPGMARNDVRPAVQQLAADGRELYDYVGSIWQTIYGPAYPSVEAGLAATDQGKTFLVKADNNTTSLYLNDNGTALLQQSLITEGDLSAPTAATKIGTSQGGTLQDALDLLNWSAIYAEPTLVFGSTDQSANIEGGAPKVMLTRSNDLAFLQVSVTARDKTAPPAPDYDALRITGLPFTANGIQPQGLWLEPDTGLPPDTYAVLVGDTIAFYRPGRVPVTADMVADNYFLRVSGIVAILPSETFE